MMRKLLVLSFTFFFLFSYSLLSQAQTGRTRYIPNPFDRQTWFNNLTDAMAAAGKNKFETTKILHARKFERKKSRMKAHQKKINAEFERRKEAQAQKMQNQ
ncbi:MAG: hypothetical protein ABIJ41_05160 [Candidatus Omnitrophota bacterium]